MQLYALLFVFMIVTLPGSLGRRCSFMSDCRCGEICVGRFNRSYCFYGERCLCRRGCAVADEFLPAWTSRRNIYCNRCSCPGFPASSKSIPACTRRAWCHLPRFTQLYPGTVNCDEQPE